MPPKKATSTPSAPRNEPSLGDQLKTLVSSAGHHYALKQYASAAEDYSRAVELQDTINGEMASENADLLYLYGRALYHVAVSKSDVLGGQVASEKSKSKKGGKKKGRSAEASSSKSKDSVTGTTSNTENGVKPGGTKAGGKAFFQIEGDDADWDTDEEEDGEDIGDEDGDAEDGPTEDDDDFTISYEILETARVLLSRQVNESTNVDPSTLTHAAPTTSKSEPPNPFSDSQLADTTIRARLDRLADIHDLQSEISLENENFTLAISDARASLALKNLIFPYSSRMIAEMHLKLALALEMAAQTTTKGIEDDQLGRNEGETAGVDEDMMKEAVSHMEQSIESTKIRVTDEKKLVSELTGDAKADKEKDIKDVEVLLSDLEARLIEMREPPVAMNAAMIGPNGMSMDGPAAAIRGLLGSMLGASPEEQKKQLEEAKKNANDLTGMVKRKTKEAVPAAAGVKRKADDGAAADAKDNGKKARVEDADGEDELA